ncbi:MAG: hypothetical protein NZ957_04585 [Thaumarchaeota archaeon]|nr:hypothetical protein [Candidatus Calditenuaceae archaeon]MDW8041432.1 hypothetical protein [Nitrososphaerota archaeon]
MAAERGVRARIADYFRRAGYLVAIEEDQILISQGSSEGCVKVVDEEVSISELVSALMEASMEVGKGRFAYVATPRRIADRVGEYVFRVHGLGLVTYDDLSVEEVVPPRVRTHHASRHSEGPQTHAPVLEEMRGAINELLKKMDALENALKQRVIDTGQVAGSTARANLENLIDRLERLEVRVSSLEQLGDIVSELESIKAHLARLAKRVEALEAGDRRMVTVEVGVGNEEGAARGQEGLPSFLRDNPWVEILSRRGRD